MINEINRNQFEKTYRSIKNKKEIGGLWTVYHFSKIIDCDPKIFMDWVVLLTDSGKKFSTTKGICKSIYTTHNNLNGFFNELPKEEV